MNASSDIRRHETQVDLSFGPPRFRRGWFASDPSQAMILVHGYAEHCGRYDEMAMHFAERGFNVHAFDQAGHGRTPGPRGHVKNFASLLDDLVRFVEIVRLEEPGRPLVLVGHSMGGLVAAATAAFRRPDVDRVVLSGAALAVADNASKIQLLIARLLAPMGSRVAMAAGLDLAGLSRDPEVLRRYQEDPYVKDRMSAAFASGMMRMAADAGQAGAHVERPVLVLHGGADPISPPIGSERFFAGLAPTIATQSRLEIYPELRHEIFNEPERHAVWQDVLEWLESDGANDGR